MNRFKLTKEEKEIEKALLRGEYIPIKGKELKSIEKALNIRITSSRKSTKKKLNNIVGGNNYEKRI